MDIIVSRIGNGWQAAFGSMRWRCAVGRNGICPEADKTEGDGASPAGCWPIRRVLYRADRMPEPAAHFPCVAINERDGWCDDPAHPLYNRQVLLPFEASHEELWREDSLYDCIVVLGHNDDPVVAGKGSAVFLHIASAGYGPTAGCAALSREDLLVFLAAAKPGARLCFKIEI